ncbi:FAD-dependent oxidoreductase [Edaphobacter albus]|uniref:FAD-dependent oxidoreductase n=1 Tax=Edaphobacter sp. 4G125 TaxID=2763071 RepID=UPI0016471A02|nr:FAD-binding oxidoreductase [Edaphobacter sp. 4G125]QNI35566.1 FAD-binding oxidoreductase [Edaphobacter sp. 4G125]
MAIEIVSSDDIRFERLSHGQNGRFPATEHDRASRIALCDNSDDVAEALERFIHQGLRPTVRSGGHCYEDFVDNNPGGAIIDLSLLAGTEPPAHGPKYRLGAGCTLGQAYPNLYKRALVTIPGGTCGPVGAGGHISGGGYGLLSRLHGVTPDWVSAVDIVTIDAAGKAHVRHANKSTDADLLRACRGAGGGNFGIITNFYFDTLPTAPAEVINGGISFEWEGMTEERFSRILYLFGNYWETRGQDPDTWGLFSIFGLTHRSSGHLNISVAFTNPDGTVNDTRVLDEYLAVFDECKPVAELTRHPAIAEHHPEPNHPGSPVCLANHTLNKLSWIDANSPSGGFRRPPGQPQLKFRHKYKSSYMKHGFTKEEAAIFYKHLNRTIPGVDLKGCVVLSDSFGGAVNKKQMLEETSLVQRESVLKCQFIASWTDPAQDAGHAQWIRDLFTELYGKSTAGAKYNGTPFWSDQYEGCYINYPDADMLQYDYWPQLYYGTGELYPFLQKVKKKYDPNNIFHHAMSIRT